MLLAEMRKQKYANAKKLEDFIARYSDEHKQIPLLSVMCDALNFETCSQVGALLRWMRADSRFVVKKKHRPESDDRHIYAWLYRRYLRYRTIHVPRSRQVRPKKITPIAGS